MVFWQEKPAFGLTTEDVQVLTNAKEYRTELLRLIGAAKKRIYITALYLQDDESGQMVLDALYTAKQKNPQLDVKVFVDYLRAQRGLMCFPESVGNVRLYREYAKKYTQQIDILGVPVKTREVLGVLHLK